MEDKIISSRGGEKRMRPHAKGAKNHRRFWAPRTVMGEKQIVRNLFLKALKLPL